MSNGRGAEGYFGEGDYQKSRIDEKESFAQLPLEQQIAVLMHDARCISDHFVSGADWSGPCNWYQTNWGESGSDRNFYLKKAKEFIELLKQLGGDYESVALKIIKVILGARLSSCWL